MGYYIINQVRPGPISGNSATWFEFTDRYVAEFPEMGPDDLKYRKIDVAYYSASKSQKIAFSLTSIWQLW